MKTEKLLGIAAFIIIFLVGVCYYQDRVLKKYKDVVEQIDTTYVIKRDTIDVSTHTSDTVPVIIKETSIRVDTLYQKIGDSTYTQIPIPIKKKCMKTF